MAMYALGIDLGTTFTAAATWRAGHTEIASLGSRAASIPSVVLLREDEIFLTGETANRRALTEPQRVAREFKRRLGDPTPILLGGAPYSAEALTARLLRSVVDEVASREGGPPSAICVCHPANWGPYKTDLLRQAVRMADLQHPVTLTTEPEAAAVFYAHQQRIDPDAVVAVYDLGGGTFDAAVLRKTATGFEILGQPEGIERLGGIDFDAAVFNHVRQALGGKLEELDEDDPAAIAAVARLKEECTQAKEALSADTDATVPVLLPNVSTEVRLTRAELEAMVRPSLYDSIEALKRALRSAGVVPEQLHSVLLVGGSSRMPIVAQLVGAELGRPVAVDAHPKHAIALGAAWIASDASADRAATDAAAGATAAAAGATAAAAAATPAGAPAAAATPAEPAPRPEPAQHPAEPASTVEAARMADPAPPAGPGPQQDTAPPAEPARPVTPVPSSPEAPTMLMRGVPEPPPPAAPAPRGAGAGLRRRATLVTVGGLAVAVIAAAAVALALRGDEDRGQGQQAKDGATPSTSAQAQTAPPAVPPDEQCTDEIKKSRRWVCLSEATFDGESIVIEYTANFAGASPNVSGGYHLHVYGGDGTTPAAETMGVQSANPGAWYVDDENPSVRRATGRDYTRAIGDAPKVCARIANARHELMPDANGTYQTGNCVPIQSNRPRVSIGQLDRSQQPAKTGGRKSGDRRGSGTSSPSTTPWADPDPSGSPSPSCSPGGSAPCAGDSASPTPDRTGEVTGTQPASPSSTGLGHEHHAGS
jgi:molecular chaperone DnaK